MKFLMALMMIATFRTANASVEVLFHPHDPTLEKIARWIEEADSTVDIAMYNMDTTNGSPIIQTLSSSAVQERIRSGRLVIRMALELYGTDEENAKKRQTMEDLGVDVKFLGRSVKAHHKFAVLDAHGDLPRVITGSANWSLSSYRGYNENILFFTQEPEATSRYQQEFDRLWKGSKEFGFSGDYSDRAPVEPADQSELEIFFNSPRTLDKGSDEESNLTEQIVRLIDGAQAELDIASTRIRLVPVLEAIRRAADRGVKIYAVISQDDFHDLGKRAQYLFKHPNIELRVKFYNLDLAQYMRFQMHNKFMIVDGETLVTGSFNWSKSSEDSHLENIAILSGGLAGEVLPTYQQEFNDIWDLGRGEYNGLVDALLAKTHTQCEIPQMVLAPKEINQLLKLSLCK